MKVLSLAVLAGVAQSAAGFAPTANQRQLASKNVAFVKSSAASTYSRAYSRGAMSMELEAFLGAGVGYLGLVLSGAASTAIVSGPSITILAQTADRAASSSQAPSAVKDNVKMYDLLLAKEVKAAEKEARADAKVRIGILFNCCCE